MRSMVMVLAMVAAGLVGTSAPAQAETYLIDDREAFDAALPHLVLEDFETGTIEGIVQTCGVLVSRDVPTGCFADNGLQPGIVLLTDTYPDPARGVIGGVRRGNHGVASKMLIGSGEVIIGFTEPVDTVGLDLAVEYVSNRCDVTVYPADGGAPEDFSIDCYDGSDGPRFVGITSDRLIRGIRIEPQGASPVIDNVRFGLRVPNDARVAAVRKDTSTGSATLVVKVPGAGVTSVRGTGVRSVRARSNEQQQVRLPVTPIESTKRRLDRTGAAIVRLKVTFLPTGGYPRTVTETVRLVKARR